MIDFLTFKSFISTEVLMMFYYLGAIVLPITTWILLIWLTQKYKIVHTTVKSTQKILWQALSPKQKSIFILFFGILFLFMELFWRMFFEFLIAYMQMRDALLLT